MPKSDVFYILICIYLFRSEEEIKAVISVEEESRIASFATNHKLSKRVLELYYISAKLKAYSKESKVNSSSCPEKIAMVYLYRDRRDRFECVHSLINVLVFFVSHWLALHVEAFKRQRECFPNEKIENHYI